MELFITVLNYKTDAGAVRQLCLMLIGIIVNKARNGCYAFG